MLSLFLAFRNVVRNRERSLLTLIGVLLAIGSFVAMVSLAEGFSHRISWELDSRNVQLYVLPKRSLALPSGPLGTVGYSQDTVSAEVRDRIGEMPNVQSVDGINRATWSGRRALLPVIFLERQSIAAYFPGLSGLPSEIASNQIVLGEGLAAQEFGSALSGKVVQQGQNQFEVVGVVKGGGFQDYFAFVKPPEENNGFHEVWVQLRDPAMAVGNAQEIRSWLPADVEVVTQKQYLAKTSTFVHYAWLLQVSVASIGVLIAVTASMNTMLMSTYERLREFAVLRAIGASRATVGAMLLWESLMLSGAGGLLGCLFGILASGVLDQAVIVLLQLPFPLAKVTPLLLLQGMLLSALVGVLGALIPLVLVWRQRIMNGLRSE